MAFPLKIIINTTLTLESQKHIMLEKRMSSVVVEHKRNPVTIGVRWRRCIEMEGANDELEPVSTVIVTKESSELIRHVAQLIYNKYYYETLPITAVVHNRLDPSPAETTDKLKRSAGLVAPPDTRVTLIMHPIQM